MLAKCAVCSYDKKIVVTVSKIDICFECLSHIHNLAKCNNKTPWDELHHQVDYLSKQISQAAQPLGPLGT